MCGMDKQEVLAKRQEYQRELDRLERERAALGANDDGLFDSIAEVIDTLRDTPKIYLKATRADKVRTLRAMASGIVLTADNATATWVEPFAFLMTDDILELGRGKGELVRKCPVMLPRQDSNLRPGG